MRVMWRTFISTLGLIISSGLLMQPAHVTDAQVTGTTQETDTSVTSIMSTLASAISQSALPPSTTSSQDDGGTDVAESSSSPLSTAPLSVLSSTSIRSSTSIPSSSTPPIISSTSTPSSSTPPIISSTSTPSSSTPPIISSTSTAIPPIISSTSTPPSSTPPIISSTSTPPSSTPPIISSTSTPSSSTPSSSTPSSMPSIISSTSTPSSSTPPIISSTSIPSSSTPPIISSTSTPSSSTPPIISSTSTPSILSSASTPPSTSSPPVASSQSATSSMTTESIIITTPQAVDICSRVPRYCPENSECKSNSTGASCQCKENFYSSDAGNICKKQSIYEGEFSIPRSAVSSRASLRNRRSADLKVAVLAWLNENANLSTLLHSYEVLSATDGTDGNITSEVLMRFDFDNGTAADAIFAEIELLPSVTIATTFEIIGSTNIRNCEILSLNPCDTDRATCTTQDSALFCGCKDGFVRSSSSSATSYSCTDLDECDVTVSPCLASSACHNTVGSYVCICSDGSFEDKGICPNVCEGTDCGEGGSCAVSQDKPVCLCAEGKTGDNCEVAASVASNNEEVYRWTTIGAGIIVLFLAIALVVVCCTEGRRRIPKRSSTKDSSAIDAWYPPLPRPKIRSSSNGMEMSESHMENGGVDFAEDPHSSVNLRMEARLTGADNAAFLPDVDYDAPSRNELGRKPKRSHKRQDLVYF